MIGEFVALSGAILLAAGSLFYRKVVEETDVVSANMIRIIPAILFYIAFLIIFRRVENLLNINAISLIIIFLSAILSQGLADTLQFRSFQLIGVARSVAIVDTYPLFVAFIAFTLLSEKLTVVLQLGTVVIILGIWLLSREKGEWGKMTNIKLGIALSISASFCYASAIIIVKKLLTSFGIIELNFVRMPMAFLVLLILSFLKREKGKWWKCSGRVWKYLILGSLCTLCVGNMVLLLAIQMIGATKMASLSSTEPLFTILLSYIILREKIARVTVLSALIIVFGTWLVVIG